jgi:S-DNA-T family DNA segregation ATPase FtsK/SpoIIIE
MRLTYNAPAGVTYYPYLLELIENNHVLIAGTTGAGKSVLENAIIHSLLAVKYPGGENGAKLVLIDPKRVELTQYKKLPHTLAYGETIPEIKTVLHYVRQLIESRLERMKKQGIRKSTDAPIYVFIDEIVDLVTSKQGKEITRILADCASISRATNIFFICLTQSPARVIIPAQFKLLFNARVALRCNNPIESRQIIETDEATELPLHGLAIVQKDLERYYIKIPLIPDHEITKIVKFWEKQHPIYNALKRRKSPV